VQDAGFHYLSAADHVLGVDASTRPDWSVPYDVNSAFRELFVLFGFLAGVTNLELMSAILVLSQRQTAVVAKQAAEVDLLTGGKVRLGVGVGWNAIEFQGLGIDFHTRGAYFEEQLQVLRLLWTERVVSFEGRFHHIDRAGICPLPVQRPIPLWLGGVGRQSGTNQHRINRVIDRIGRLADGWISGPKIESEIIIASFAAIKQAAERAGRDPAQIGLQASVHIDQKSDNGEIARAIADRRLIGATHLTMETRNAGLSLEENVDLIGRIGEVLKAEG
jgi:probable F420-dependent oxidoreductase